MSRGSPEQQGISCIPIAVSDKYRPNTSVVINCVTNFLYHPRSHVMQTAQTAVTSDARGLNARGEATARPLMYFKYRRLTSTQFTCVQGAGAATDLRTRERARPGH